MLQIRLGMHRIVSNTPELPGPVSSSWTTAARAFALVICAVRTLFHIHLLYSCHATPHFFKKLRTGLNPVFFLIFVLTVVLPYILTVLMYVISLESRNIFYSHRDI